MTSARDVARIFEYLSMQSDGAIIEKTRLNKLLYFAQGHALAEFGHELFPNQIDAWAHGPVVAAVYSGYDKIVQRAQAEGIADIQASPQEMEIILDVWDQYRGYKASELVEMTHEEDTPWSEAYVPGMKDRHIPQEAIRRFFARPENGLNHGLKDIGTLPTVDALPAEEYDPEEDAVWEALLDAAQ
ncbi:MAG: DUF4065 domain-containing protein [Clostridia bacterium]|nr:DUF4065 domain-containing protein [Clostridia bacterium]